MHPLWIVLIVIASMVILYAILSFIVACLVLKMATRPTAHTLEEAIEVQSKETSLDGYLNQWNKQPFEVDGRQGKIRGEVVFHPDKQSQSRAKVVIICHGHTWNRINSVKYANIFYGLGYSIIMYDHAYCGQSDGKYSTLGYYEKYDLSAVIDYAKTLFGSDAFIALHGESMGAATVLSLLQIRNDVNYVVADCGFSHTMKYYRELCMQITHLPAFPVVDFANMISKAKMGYDFNKSVPLDGAKMADVPVCFIHGEADDFINCHHSVDMYNVAKNTNCQLHLFKGAGHATSLLTDEAGYYKVITDFAQKIENLQK